MADKEFHDPERVRLIGELQRCFNRETLPSETWAMLWLSDIDCLQCLVNDEETHSSFCFFGIKGAATLCRPWTTRTDLPAETSTPREPILTELLCFHRDRQRCQVTDAGLPLGVASIYPPSMGNDTELEEWRPLIFFWFDNRVKAWKEEVANGTPQTVANLISLAPNVSRYWRKAMFALKPIDVSDDGKTLRCRLFWLPSNKAGPRTITTPPTISNNAESTGDNIKLFNNTTRRMIYSGCPIEFYTDDPQVMPLPSFEFLKMQWILNRVAALSGAPDEDDSNYISDEYYDETGHWIRVR